MIQLFNINNYTINTADYSNLLHDKIVEHFEEAIAFYVGANYAVSVNSATSAIFLALLDRRATVRVPSMIPPAVVNAIITSGNEYEFVDNIDWVGNSYILHDFGDYKIVDSAQKLEKDQFRHECNPNDLMIFSFYPTKPVGSCDGGMIVSNDLERIMHLRELTFNGMSFSHNSWKRKIKFPGYKMYMNSIQCDIALRNFKVYNKKIEALLRIREKYNDAFGYRNTSNYLYRLSVPDRLKFISHMNDRGIACGIHYEALHLNSVYKKNCILKRTENESIKTVSIPFHEKLTNENIRYIIDGVNNL